jgi:hypothetical protein
MILVLFIEYLLDSRCEQYRGSAPIMGKLTQAACHLFEQRALAGEAHEETRCLTSG